MDVMKPICFLFIFILNLFSQEWHLMEGKYSTLEYPSKLQSVADSLFSKTESILPKLSLLMNYPTSSLEETKVRVYLTDAPDVSNGFAVGNTVVIYATSSHFLPNWTGTATWYNRVLTHELVHHMMFRKIYRTPKVLGLGTAFALGFTPRWFSEGLAQYYAEEWDYYRGDYRLKAAVLEGTLSLSRINSDLSLAYPAGHAFIRFLATRYGDQSLIQLMEHEPKRWAYNFDRAFKEVYKHSLYQIFQEFQRELVMYYGHKYAQTPQRKDSLNLFSVGYRTYQMTPLNSDSLYLISSRLSAQDLHSSAYIIDKKKQGKVPQFITNEHGTGLFPSESGRSIAYGKPAVYYERNERFFRFDWFIYNTTTKEETEVYKDLRTRYASFLNEQTLVLTEVHPDYSELSSIDLSSKEKTVLFHTKNVLGKVATFNGQIFVEMQDQHGFRNIFKLIQKTLHPMTTGKKDSRNPVVINDSTLFFNRLENETFSVFSKNLNTGKERRVIYDQEDYILHSSNKQMLIFKRFGLNLSSHFFALSADSLTAEQALPELKETVYGSWRKKRTEKVNLLHISDSISTPLSKETVSFPQKGMANFATGILPIYSKQDGFGFIGGTVWAEPLSRQVLSLFAYVKPNNWKASVISFLHHLKFSNTQLNTTYTHAPVVFNHFELPDMYYDQVSFQFSKPMQIGRRSRSLFIPSVSYRYLHTQSEGISYSIHGARTALTYTYTLPTRLPELPKHQFLIHGEWFKSFHSDYPYSVASLKLRYGKRLLLPNLSIVNNARYIRKFRALYPYEFIGVDRFYRFKTPRDLGYSISIRGFSQNRMANQVLANTTELNYLVTNNTPLKALFLPMRNVMATFFYDYVDLGETIQSVGAEVSFGEKTHRFYLGYATAYADKQTEKTLYLRFGIHL